MKGILTRNLPKKHSEIVNQQPKLVDFGDFTFELFFSIFSHVNLQTSSCPGASECTPTWNTVSRTWAVSHGKLRSSIQRMTAHRAKNHCKMCACRLYSPCLACVIYDTISLCLPNLAKVLSNSQIEASLCCIVDQGSTASSRPSRNLSHGGDLRVDCSMSCKKSSGAVHHTVTQAAKYIKDIENG